MDESQDREITLGTGKLLGLFFGLVILCGVFLGIGYSLGRGSAKAAALPLDTTGASTTTTGASTSAKPGASQAAAAKTPDCPSGQNCTGQQATTETQQPASSDLSFYKAVEQKDANAKLTAPEPEKPATPAKTAAPELKQNVGTGYMVQIAAVSRQEDAQVLRDALQRKQYPVIITQPGDKLFHVQIGPFADVKEAEGMRSRLINEGYNPILKR